MKSVIYDKDNNEKKVFENIELELADDKSDVLISKGFTNIINTRVYYKLMAGEYVIVSE